MALSSLCPGVHAAHAVTGMSVAPCGLRSNAMATPLPDAACMAACNMAWHASVGNAGKVSQLPGTNMCGGVKVTQGPATAQANKPSSVLVGSMPCALVEPGKVDASMMPVKSAKHAASQSAVQCSDLGSHTAAAIDKVTKAANGMKNDIKNGHKSSKNSSKKLDAKNSIQLVSSKNSSRSMLASSLACSVSNSVETVPGPVKDTDSHKSMGSKNRTPTSGSKNNSVKAISGPVKDSDGHKAKVTSSKNSSKPKPSSSKNSSVVAVPGPVK